MVVADLHLDTVLRCDACVTLAGLIASDHHGRMCWLQQLQSWQQQRCLGALIESPRHGIALGWRADYHAIVP